MRDVRCSGPWRAGWGMCNALLFRASTAIIQSTAPAKVEIKCGKCKQFTSVALPLTSTC